MASIQDNLLLRLHKWAWRQEENFLTEALAYLVQYLLNNEPEAGVRMLKSLTAGFLLLEPSEAHSVEIKTQVYTAEGRPDLQLRTAKKLALMEVKSESAVDPKQLQRYRNLLRASALDSCLILLSSTFAHFLQFL